MDIHSILTASVGGRMERSQLVLGRGLWEEKKTEGKGKREWDWRRNWIGYQNEEVVMCVYAATSPSNKCLLYLQVENLKIQGYNLTANRCCLHIIRPLAYPYQHSIYSPNSFFFPKGMDLGMEE